MRCCAGDEGFVALRSRPAEGGFKPPHAALAEDRRGVVNMNAEDKSELVKGPACWMRCCAKRWRLSGPPESSCGGWLQTARICIG